MLHGFAYVLWIIYFDASWFAYVLRVRVRIG